MVAAFSLCGIGMIIIGCCFGEEAGLEDFSKMDAAKSAAKATAKGATAGAKYTYENKSLLEDA